MENDGSEFTSDTDDDTSWRQCDNDTAVSIENHITFVSVSKHAETGAKHGMKPKTLTCTIPILAGATAISCVSTALPVFLRSQERMRHTVRDGREITPRPRGQTKSKGQPQSVARGRFGYPISGCNSMIAFGTLLLAQDVWNTELRYKCSIVTVASRT